MAIKKTLELENNFGGISVIQDAYIRVLDLSATKSSVTANIEILSGDLSRRLAVVPHTFAPSLDGGNFIAQAYDYIKTLPEFNGAEDC